MDIQGAPFKFEALFTTRAPREPLFNFRLLHIFEVLASCDSCHRVKAYWHHHHGPFHPHAHWFDDIRCRNHKSEVARLGSPDVYIAGFPCPAFSSAGLNGGIEVEEGQLITHILKFLRVATPKLIILENVKGLEQRHKPVLTWILAKLKNLNGHAYQVHHKILDSNDHGLPHSRRRLWFVAIRMDQVSQLLFASSVDFQ